MIIGCNCFGTKNINNFLRCWTKQLTLSEIFQNMSMFIQEKGKIIKETRIAANLSLNSTAGLLLRLSNSYDSPDYWWKNIIAARIQGMFQIMENKCHFHSIVSLFCKQSHRLQHIREIHSKKRRRPEIEFCKLNKISGVFFLYSQMTQNVNKQ